MVGRGITISEKGILKETLANLSSEMLIFLINSGEKIQRDILRALDFTSMRKANRGSNLGRIVYRATKKDVFEYKRKEPWEALINKDVMKFAILYHQEVWSEYGCFNDNDMDYTHLRIYLETCQKEET